MADAIVALHRDPERADAIAGKAQTWALEHDASWVAARFERLYREIAGRA
jgi:hypothetical protein